MTIETTPHLNFRDQARAALAHYQAAFGGDLVATTYAEAGAPADAPGADGIVWGQVSAPSGFRVMAYDVQPDQPFEAGERAFFVSVRATGADELTTAWEVLVDGGTVVAPLAPSPWSPLYGMVTDRFGVTWVLDVAVAYAG